VVFTKFCLPLKTLNIVCTKAALLGTKSVDENDTSGQCYKTFFDIIYATSSVFPYDFDRGYADLRYNYVEKSLIKLAHVVCTINVS
jgi:hypothetical protein